MKNNGRKLDLKMKKERSKVAVTNLSKSTASVPPLSPMKRKIKKVDLKEKKKKKESEQMNKSQKKVTVEKPNLAQVQIQEEKEAVEEKNQEEKNQEVEIDDENGIRNEDGWLHKDVMVLLEGFKRCYGKGSVDKKALFQLVKFDDPSITGRKAYDYLQRLKGKYKAYVNAGRTYRRNGKIEELSPLMRAYFSIIEDVIGPDVTKVSDEVFWKDADRREMPEEVFRKEAVRRKISY